MYGLDYETFGSRPLPVVGLDNYINDPLFLPLLACTAHRDMSNQIVTNDFELVLGGDVYHDFRSHLLWLASGGVGAAHNAGFERRVTERIWPDQECFEFFDTAAAARAAGAGGKLEAAGPQLLGWDKLEDGKRLIQKFCVGDTPPGPEIVHDPEWELFKEYCRVDAIISLLLAEEYFDKQEHKWEQMTDRMNQRGWFVDRRMLYQMQRLEQENKDAALQEFRDRHDPKEVLNLNSLPQLKAWCKARGINASSFAEANVERLLKALDKRIEKTSNPQPGWLEVRDMLRTKQLLGGSSLKKLPVLDATASVVDSRLRDSYVHIGAGQSFRTTGRGAQLQNLKRLHDVQDLETLFTAPHEWTNAMLGSNIRQLLRAEHPDGELIVGDLSSIESRGLAYLAGEQWKLDAYHQGKDMYKVLAVKKYGIAYEAVTKDQRTFGKVGELSCGYGAGWTAVQDFGAGMHVELSEPEAREIVDDWRGTNEQIVGLWEKLDNGLVDAVRGGPRTVSVKLGNGFTLHIQSVTTLPSLEKIHPGALDLLFTLYDATGRQFMYRWIRGAYLRGGRVCYYKPSERKHGALWNRDYIHPKTKQRTFYSIYGGKLAGILTQSFCRQLFFQLMERVEQWTSVVSNLRLIGQFHDELVLEWEPSEDSQAITLDAAVKGLHAHMSYTDLPDFPMAAEVAHSHRYIK